MCGITGVVALSESGKKYLNRVPLAIDSMASRGPDGNGIYTHKNAALGHLRLSIIDTSSAANQPFTDPSGRYTVVFNGEFFNFQKYRKQLIDKGIELRSTGDTEVLLHLYILEGEDFVRKMNGFFALAIYDKVNETVFIARDRYGVKPFYIYHDTEKIIFSSEMKGLLAYGIKKDIDYVSLYSYLQLNYVPGNNSIFKNVIKLKPGSYGVINPNGQIEFTEYYHIDPTASFSGNVPSYDVAQKKLVELLDASVERRMISDVPLGAFLSGGIDSSVVTALAAQKTKHLKTFSIGYKDEPLFDETQYALMVAKKYKTDHTVFSLSNDDLYNNLFKVLDYIDEPFADSSAIAVHILSMHTRKHVTVALSGDGADEMLGGYNKHEAEFRIRNAGTKEQMVAALEPFLKLLPASRNTKAGNKVRQALKFAAGYKLSAKDRYWRWAGYCNEAEATALLKKPVDWDEYQFRKGVTLRTINGAADIHDVLFTDMQLVLPNDMLVKVDLMAMANSIEVRNPFLDVDVVNYCFTLPANYKIDALGRKKVLKDAFRSYLPEELYNRGKQGFEVPLLKWFRTGLNNLIFNDLLAADFIEEQGIFNYDTIEKLKKQLMSNSPGDATARVWGLLVFQYWYKKHMN
jgi:asparagine synthase (glutamine-hydrolysing)